MVKQEIRWLAPAPLWQNGGDVSVPANDAFKRPTILRFDNDDFMDELMGLLESTPDRLKGWVARTETWREPMSKTIDEDNAENNAKLLPLFKRARGLPVESKSSIDKRIVNRAENEGLKLYQPAQRRYYLISAALVCKTAGLPDRLINTSEQEKVTFILRRIINNEEYAFTASGQGFEWQKITANEKAGIKQGEERLPLFNFNYKQQATKNRRMLAGLIPVARREAYLGATLASSDAVDENENKDEEYSPLLLLFMAQVIAPWKALLQQADIHRLVMKDTVEYDEGSALELDKVRAGILKTTRENIQTVSWYILLDFADFLESYIHNIWKKIKDDSSSLADFSDDERVLFEEIKKIRLPVLTKISDSVIEPVIHPLDKEIHLVDKEIHLVDNKIEYISITSDVKANLIAALKVIQSDRDGLEKVDIPYIRKNAENSWPDFLFPLTDPESSSFDEDAIEKLVKALDKVLPKSGDNFPDLQTLKIQPNKDDNNARFIIRCVYEQPNCEPLHPPIVSEPSEAFQMASFFDPDAPARPVRIPMPMDISPSGLRKYQKNTSLVISDMLCGKIEKIKKVTFGDLVLSVLPWPFHKDLPNVNDTAPCNKGPGSNFGMICSLSIPIVTLVALILMIIMVTLFDIFFKWIPYLFMCLPIPGLKGKN